MSDGRGYNRLAMAGHYMLPILGMMVSPAMTEPTMKPFLMRAFTNKY